MVEGDSFYTARYVSLVENSLHGCTVFQKGVGDYTKCLLLRMYGWLRVTVSIAVLVTVSDVVCVRWLSLLRLIAHPFDVGGQHLY